MSTLQELISKQSPYSQARIEKKANKMHREIILTKLRNDCRYLNQNLQLLMVLNNQQSKNNTN